MCPKRLIPLLAVDCAVVIGSSEPDERRIHARAPPPKPELHPRGPHQIYRWYPWSVPDSKDGMSDPKAVINALKSLIEDAKKKYDPSKICSAGDEIMVDYNEGDKVFLKYQRTSGYDMHIGLQPQGFRVSKLLGCKDGYSMRLANYRTWYFEEDLRRPVVLNCHDALRIAEGNVRAMESDLGYWERKEANGEHYHEQSVQPEEVWNHPEYRLIGQSCWGEDWSWGVIMGYERWIGCAYGELDFVKQSGKDEDVPEAVSDSDSDSDSSDDEDD